jgi:probable F420-dependent oxidoreductase
MQLGASIPVSDIGTGPAAIRDYAQAAEGLGYAHLVAPDHVLGANPAGDHGGNRVGTTANAYHDPFVLFGFLAGCTKQIGFAVGVLILAQRQAVLVAKQAASLDALCGGGGRFRLGIGVGWNEVEFIGLNEDFHNRGRRSAEQVRVMQALWAEPHVKLDGEFHHIADAGINPRPASGRVPIWYGGHAEATFRRCARYGDGFMPLAYPPGDAALAAFDKLRRLVREAGRDPAAIGIEVWTSPGSGNEDDWRREINLWKNAGVTHVTASTTYASAHHKRIAGHSAADHLQAITRYRAAVADLL